MVAPVPVGLGLEDIDPPTGPDAFPPDVSDVQVPPPPDTVGYMLADGDWKTEAGQTSALPAVQATVAEALLPALLSTFVAWTKAIAIYYPVVITAPNTIGASVSIPSRRRSLAEPTRPSLLIASAGSPPPLD